MSKRHSPIIFFFALALSAVGHGNEPSSITDRVQTAEREAEELVDKARKDLSKALEAKRDAAQKKGDLTTYERVAAEIKAFESRGTIPKSVSTRVYERASKKALNELEKAYQRAIIDYTKAGMIDEAKRLQQRLEIVKAKKMGRPGDAVGFNGKFFKVFSDKLTWDEARTRCVQMGGRLVMVTSKEENAFITQLATEAKIDVVWLGATDQALEGQWKLIDGTQVQYSFWDSNQPNNVGNVEHYAVLLVRSGGKWWDYPNDPAAHPKITSPGRPSFICQWE